MDLLTALLACNLYTADEPLVRAIAQSNSHSNPYFVVDLVTDLTEINAPVEPTTLDAAMARLGEITSKGGQPLLGLMQVPPSWMTAFGREVRDAFEPCINMAIGTAMLASMDAECARGRGALPAKPRRVPGGPPQPARRLCVIRKYAEAIGMPEFELITTLELGMQRPLDRAAVASEAPIFFAPVQGRSWGPDCILVPVQALGVPAQGAGSGP